MIASGGELFREACGACHGTTGEGGRGPNLRTSRNVQRSNDQELFGSIKNGVPGSEMPPFPLGAEKVWSLAAFVRSLSAPAFDQHAPGDAEAGQAIFEGQAGCVGCHMIRGEGGSLGPDLSNIGMESNLTRLRESLLEPSKEIAAGFEKVVVTLKSGDRIEGVARNRSNYSLQVLDVRGNLHLLESPQIDDAEFDEQSWMPRDYGDRLSEEQVRDVLTFLARQSSSQRAAR